MTELNIIHPTIPNVNLTGYALAKAGKKPRFSFPRHVNFALGQVKIEVQWTSGRVKLVSVAL